MTQLAATFPNDDVRCWITVKCSDYSFLSLPCVSTISERESVSERPATVSIMGQDRRAGPIKPRFVAPVLIGEANKSIKNASLANVNSERDRSPVIGEGKDFFLLRFRRGNLSPRDDISAIFRSSDAKQLYNNRSEATTLLQTKLGEENI